jgi:DNA replication protein DnaC
MPMPSPTLEQKLTQLQLLSAPETLAAREARHSEGRAPIRAFLETLVDCELARRTEHQVATRLKAAKFVQVQTADTFNFED